MSENIFTPIGEYLRKTDKLFWLAVFALSVIGCMLIASQQRLDSVDFLRTQIIALSIGTVCATAVSVMDYNYAGKFWYIAGGIGLLLLTLVFFAGIRVEGTDDTGWIRLPFGMTFQPSEFVKICFIVTFSKHLAYLAEKDWLHSFLGVLTLTVHGAIPVVMIHFQGDDGAALVFGLMFLVMTFAAGVQIRYFILAFLGMLCAVPFLWAGVLNSEQKNRLAVLFSSDDTMFKTYGWQQYQGKVSIASGGLFGKGLFNGPRVAREIVPYQENDFIFTVAGEELGFIGCTAILALFGLMLFRVLKNSARSKNALGKNICIGFFALISIQVLINLGMVLGVLPVVGITLPFLSSGGTSVLCLYIGAGLVQSVYMHPTYEENLSVKLKTRKYNQVFV